MTVLYSNDFDAEADGSLPTGFVTLAGGGYLVQPGTSVGATPVSGLKVFGRNSVGDSTGYSASGALGNQGLRTDFVVDTVVIADFKNISHLLRASATVSPSYRVGCLPVAGAGSSVDLGLYIGKYDSGNTTFASTTAVINVVATDIVHLYSECVDNGAGSCILSAYLWKNADSKPGTPSLTYTVASGAIATGYPGLQNTNPSFGWATIDNLVITDAAGGDGYFDAVDTTAPTLTSPTGTQTGSTTATIGATTDEANGTMYGVVTTSGTAPSVAQIQAGQDNSGTAAAYASSQAITTTGAKTFSATGLAASTAYYAHIQHKDAAANDSTVVSSAQFTTAAGAGASAQGAGVARRNQSGINSFGLRR
jgi:hypothetical protein